MFGSLRTNQRAFTLVEILVVLAIFAVLMIFFFSFNNFFQGKGQVDKTRKRMEKIVSAAQKYYLSHENLPVFHEGLPVSAGDVPVDALNIEARYRLDPWGQPFQYFTFTNDGQNGRPGEIQIDALSAGGPAGAVAMVVINVASRTLIRAVEVDGRQVSGVIISSGPDQVFNFAQTDAYPQVFTPDLQGDDVFMAIDVNQQATRIALSELKVLNDKAKAFDERFVGIDNNDDGQYDEDGCDAIPYPGPGIVDYHVPSDDCADLYIEEAYLPITENDYSCGLPTLDFMKAAFCGQPWVNCDIGYYFPQIQRWIWVIDPVTGNVIRQDCPTMPTDNPDYFRIPFVRGAPDINDCHWGLVETLWGPAPAPDETDADQARAFIFCLNNLSPTAIVDPWLSGYIWGCGNDECQNQYLNGDPHYHRFFSAGPDGFPTAPAIDLDNIDILDDIIS